MRPGTVTRRPRATVRSRRSRAAPGIRPEVLRPPATGSLTGEGLRPFRALRRDHPTWGLASGCGERTRPETKSAAPVAEQTPHDEVRSFVRKGRAERRKACASSPMRVRAFTGADKPRRCAFGAPSPLVVAETPGGASRKPPAIPAPSTTGAHPHACVWERAACGTRPQPRAGKGRARLCGARADSRQHSIRPVCGDP